MFLVICEAAFARRWSRLWRELERQKDHQSTAVRLPHTWSLPHPPRQRAFSESLRGDWRCPHVHGTMFSLKRDSSNLSCPHLGKKGDQSQHWRVLTYRGPVSCVVCWRFHMEIWILIFLLKRLEAWQHRTCTSAKQRLADPLPRAHTCLPQFSLCSSHPLLEPCRSWRSLPVNYLFKFPYPCDYFSLWADPRDENADMPKTHRFPEGFISKCV